jgi:hypothetical protein
MMMTRPNLSFPTPKPTSILHRGKPVETALDLIIALAVATGIAVALILFL